ncbi:hypothetical protein RAH32_17020 [Paracoccus sp. WLY502]|nr:hypothetical protein [Paracoccus sp. WLY502]MDQ1902132.1 hypothetical protein [Paracoccus sp. WLY502]
MSIVKTAKPDNLRLMFDCYHLPIRDGDISRRLRMHLDILSQVQIASV